MVRDRQLPKDRLLVHACESTVYTQDNKTIYHYRSISMSDSNYKSMQINFGQTTWQLSQRKLATCVSLPLAQTVAAGFAPWRVRPHIEST